MVEHRFFDSNGDGTVDIVPHLFDVFNGANVLAWLNDGTGHYVALKTTTFGDMGALERFGEGVRVRADGRFKYLDFHGDGTHLAAHAGVVIQGAVLGPRF